MEATITTDKQLDGLKVPPHSVEAEQAVLGGLLLNGQAWDSVVEIINTNDFYRAEHQQIFSAIQLLVQQNSPLDVLTLAETLKLNHQLERCGGEIYLFELARNTPSADNIVAYAEIVRDRSVKRQLIHVGQEIASLGFNAQGRERGLLLDEAERKVFAIADQVSRGLGPKHVNQYLASTLDQLHELYASESPLTGLPTGYHDFDKLTSGLQPADLVIIAGRPSMGKTMLAMNIAEYAVLKKRTNEKTKPKPVVIFSLEMPGEALTLRLISSLGRIEQQKVRSGKLSDADWSNIPQIVELLEQAPLFIDDTPALSPGELRARARRLAKEHGDLGLIVVDYLQLMQVPESRDNRVAEISEISRSLKNLAKELNVPVIALSQLNRGLEQRPNKRPIMSDLRESGAIEQDADLIVFIYRDEVYHPDSPDKGTAEIIIAKHRNGPTDKFRLTFLGHYNRFENYQPFSMT